MRITISSMYFNKFIIPTDDSTDENLRADNIPKRDEPRNYKTPPAALGIVPNKNTSSKLLTSERNTANHTPPLSPVLFTENVKRSLKVPMPAHRKPTTKRDSSPNNSVFSCESNATLYTELPLSFTGTPSTDRGVSRLSHRNFTQTNDL